MLFRPRSGTVSLGEKGRRTLGFSASDRNVSRDPGMLEGRDSRFSTALVTKPIRPSRKRHSSNAYSGIGHQGAASN